MQRCLYCYKMLDNGEIDFHSRCAKKIFDSTTVPIIDFSRTKVSELAEQVIRSQSAVTGVQTKLSLDLQKVSSSNPQRFTIVGLWGKYILKPQTKQFRSLPEIEDLTMHLADLAKIQTVPHSLIRFNDGELAYITKRIDRAENEQKFAMEDMCQLTERLTEDKYKGSYEQIAKAIEKFSSAPLLDTINFYEQVVFSFITGNADMHLKNFSLIALNKNKYRLSAGYDMLSTKIVMPEDKEELALTLNGKKNKIKKNDFIIAMQKSNLQDNVINRIFLKFQKLENRYLECIENSFLPNDMKEQYKLLITENLAKFN